MTKAIVKEWFENKLAEEFKLPSLYDLEIFCEIKQSEKAVYAMFFTGYDASGKFGRRRCGWIPKSCIENIENLRVINDYDEAVKAFAATYTM